MERKDFLKNSLALAGITTVIAQACKKTATGAVATAEVTNAESASCIVTPGEVEGPFPYPGGEITNPLNRKNIRDGEVGRALTLIFSVVNINDDCAVVPNARIDIWHCNKDGYYSGYANQQGYLGIKNYTGETWLRGYQVTNSKGKATFHTIYPGWYGGRATHIHFEVFVNNVLKKTGQLAFDETITNKVYAGKQYKAHGINPTTNSSDNIFGNSSTDLVNEMAVLVYDNAEKTYTGTYTVGISL